MNAKMSKGVPIFSSTDQRSELALELRSSRWTAAQIVRTGPTYLSFKNEKKKREIAFEDCTCSVKFASN